MNAAAIKFLLEVLTNGLALVQAITKTNQEGRDLNPEELQSFIAEDDAARQRLQAEIDKAKQPSS